MKDFARWHHLKSFLDNYKSGHIFREREIWLVSTGLNVGHEQDGKHRKFLRPVVIIKKFNKDMFWGVPLTSQPKDNKYFCYPIKFPSRDSFAVPLQLRAMDKKRLFKKIGALSDADFDGLRKILTTFLE